MGSNLTRLFWGRSSSPCEDLFFFFLERERKVELWNWPNISGEKSAILPPPPPSPFIIMPSLYMQETICKPSLLSAGTLEACLTGTQRAAWHYLWIPCSWLRAVMGGCQFCKGSIICCSRRSAPECSFAWEDECLMHSLVPLLSPLHSCWVSHSSEQGPESASLPTSREGEKTLWNGAFMVGESKDT